MGITAENLQEKWNIGRKEQDEFACRSQTRTKKAIETGYVKENIIPVVIPAKRKTPEIIVNKDEHPRPETTIEGLAKLKPVFKEGGTVTSGFCSGYESRESTTIRI